MKLSDKLKYLRQSKGLTIQELSTKLFGDIRRGGTISIYETGKVTPNASTLKKYSQYFNVPLEYFYSLDIDKPITDEELKQQQQEVIHKINNILGELDIDNLNIIYKVAKGLFK